MKNRLSGVAPACFAVELSGRILLAVVKFSIHH